MRVGALIFSRYDSSRLLGKALKSISGRELLGRVLDRASALSTVNGIVVATSTREIDNAIVSYTLSEGFEAYRGDAENVALRATQACKEFGWDAFVRICGDRPFFDPAIADRAVIRLVNGGYDLVTTNGTYQLPPGLTTEVVSCDALMADLDSFSDFNKEHLTSFFYENPSRFNISYEEHSRLSKTCYNTRLVVDDEDDLARAEWIASKIDRLGREAQLDSERILQLACKWDASMLASTDETSK